jgi:poly(3-hydroxybutyrate) depolymerase
MYKWDQCKRAKIGRNRTLFGMIQSVLFLMSYVLVVAAVAGKQTEYSGTINNLARKWIFYVPENLPTKPALVFYLHGCCADYKTPISLVGYNAIADRDSIIVCYSAAVNTPGQLDNRDWDVISDRDLKFIMALLDTAKNKFHINENRVYATGFSMGGFMSNYLGCMYPEKFAAIAPSSGGIFTFKGTPRSTDCVKGRAVPVHHMHGTTDDVVNYKTHGAESVRYWVKHNGCPEPAVVTNNLNGKSKMKKEVWGPCGDDSAQVVLITCDGCGHQFMAQSTEGVTEGLEGWNFMKKYSLKDGVTRVNFSKEKNNSNGVFSMATVVYTNGVIELSGIDKIQSAYLFDIKGCRSGEWLGICGKTTFNCGMLVKGVYLLYLKTTKGSQVSRVVVQK